MAPVSLPTLPCFPCPHRSTCCAYGTTVSEEEATAIIADHGEDRVYLTRWGEWRTRVTRGRCVFFGGDRCLIHDRPYYPAVCRGFPWTEADSGDPYPYDRTICLEFVRRPELLQVHPAKEAQP